MIAACQDPGSSLHNEHFVSEVVTVFTQFYMVKMHHISKILSENVPKTVVLCRTHIIELLTKLVPLSLVESGIL